MIFEKHWSDFRRDQGLAYFQDGDLAQAYICLLRYSALVVKWLPDHPEAKRSESRSAYKPLLKRTQKVLSILEGLRAELNETYKRYQQSADKRRAALRHSLYGSISSTYGRHAANDPTLAWSYASEAEVLDAGAYQDLAVDLAKREMRRRRDRDEDRQRRVAGYWADWKQELDRRREEERGVQLERQEELLSRGEAKRDASRYMDDDDWRQQMKEARRQLDQAHDTAAFIDHYSYQTTTYNYPAISKSSAVRYEKPSISQREEASRPLPPRPPKELPLIQPLASPPPPPDKTPLELGSPPPCSSSVHDEEAPPLPPKALAPPPAENKRVTFRPAAYLENGQPLRPVFLPSSLRRRFLDMAAENTRKNLEMCGILCGTTVNNALFISHLVIPEQECTPNTCETVNEQSLFNYCDEHELIVIGWIHTHPTQTCFMSSRDLHTHSGYQVMMPESIAIVCAPSYDE